MHCHCGTNNRAPRWTFTDPCKPGGETSCLGGVSVSCLASRTRYECERHNESVNMVKIGDKVQFGNKFANWSNVWSIEGVNVYGKVPEWHVTFGERETS